MNRHHNSISRSILCGVIILLLSLPSLAGQVTKQLAPGVTLFQDINIDPNAPLVVNAVIVDLATQGVELKAALCKDVVYVDDASKGRETISSLTARKSALVGINADFFPFTGDPLSTCVIDGELISEPSNNRACLALSENNDINFDNPKLNASLTMANGVTRQIDGINRVRETNEVVVYTEAFGASTQNKYKSTDIICTSPYLLLRIGKPIKLTVSEVRLDALNTPIPKGGVVISGGGPASFLLKENIKPGDVITAQFNVKSACNLDWTNIEQAAGGGPWLLKDGNVCIDFAEENWNSTFSTTKHPRSAAGVTSDGKLILVTVDGRQSISTGISLQDLALLMKRLGAVNAINLDGGGSTTLSVKGFLINSVSEGDERPVADALLVYAHQPICPGIPKLKISTASTEFASGQGVQLALTSGDDAKPLTQDQLDKVIWGTTGGIGLVNQQGYFTPIKAGKGMIGAMIDSQSTEIVVNVVAGNPSKLTAQLVADKVDPLRSILSITASDANNNKVTGKEVLLNITGGKSDLESGITDDKGNFSTGITWDAASTERSAVAIVGNISAEAK